ncbi:hypothetical protein ABET52_13190 [Saccharococcus caldoxylosilyticus]|nr:hypothetical protein [Parageobacillus caldoxylosilyticus]
MCKVADKSKVNGPIYLVRKTGAKAVTMCKGRQMRGRRSDDWVGKSVY